jgi:outer membrane protein assembly factor BamB
MRPIRRGLVAASLLGCISTVSTILAAPSDSWPSFRGTNRTAVSSETGLLQEWPTSGPALLYEIKGAGEGYSSLAIAGGRIYTLGNKLSTASDQDEYLSCFDEATKQQLWKTKTGPAWASGQPAWQSSRSTPTVDGDLVFVLTPHGRLVCCETATGKQVWQKDMRKDFKGDKGDGWGYSESVLVDGEHVVCTPGKSEMTMVALNKKTGDLVWSASRPDDRGAGHASIAVSNVGGTKVYVQTTAGGALGVRAEDGELMWSYPIDKTTAVAPSPIIRDDLVFFAAGYGRGGALLRQIPESGGKVRMEQIYGLKQELANKHGGIVLVGDYLYGDSDDKGIPFCAELMTGEVKWKKRSESGKNSAAIVAADGRLYLRFANGTMVLAKADPADYVEVGSFSVPHSGQRPSWAHPVIVDGKLYLREQDTILCYDIRAAKQ